MSEYTSIKAGLFTYLTDLGVTPYVYHRELPQNPSYPATVYDVVSQPPVGLTHDIGTVGFRYARVQIDVYALTVDEAENAMEKYFDLLKSFVGSLGVPGFTDVDIWDEGANPDMDFEEEPTLRQIEGRSRDFMIHW